MFFATGYINGMVNQINLLPKTDGRDSFLINTIIRTANNGSEDHLNAFKDLKKAFCDNKSIERVETYDILMDFQLIDIQGNLTTSVKSYLEVYLDPKGGIKK